MEQYNVLILSAGRRVELVQLFQKAARDLKIKSKIVAGDCDHLAPALYFADDKVMLPKISEINYISEIIRFSNEKDIKLIVPTIDTDLLLLSKNKYIIEKNTKAIVLISSEEVVLICRDKIKTQEFMEKNKFPVPRRYEAIDVNHDTNFPLFIKPISGSSSINAFKVASYKEFKEYIQIVPSPMIQECVFGDEYTVDVFLDFNSNVISVVPRLRIAVRSGEISKGKIVKDQYIIDEIVKLMNVLKPVGHITVQLIKTIGGIKYIEINPRFGGGAPMSIMSGADSCKNLYKLLQNHRLTYNDDYEENLIFLRYDSSISIKSDI